VTTSGSRSPHSGSSSLMVDPEGDLLSMLLDGEAIGSVLVVSDSQELQDGESRGEFGPSL
jgi:hypothetical protein